MAGLAELAVHITEEITRGQDEVEIAVGEIELDLSRQHNVEGVCVLSHLENDFPRCVGDVVTIARKLIRLVLLEQKVLNLVRGGAVVLWCGGELVECWSGAGGRSGGSTTASTLP